MIRNMIEESFGMIPDIGIDWPVSIPILSDKDSKLPLLKNIEWN